MEKRYIIYYRLSKEGKQSKNNKGKGSNTLGIDAQRTIVHHYYGDKIIEEYQEVRSGKEMSKRIELKRAIAHVRSTPGTILVVAKTDRISRKIDDVLDIYNQLNGQLICCDIPSGDAPVERFNLLLYSLIADRERELIGIRTKGALAELKKKGVKLGTQKPGAGGHPNIENNFTHEQRIHNAHMQRDAAIANGNTKRACTLIDQLVKQGNTWRVIAAKLNDGDYHTRNKNAWTMGNAHRVYQRYIVTQVA